MKSNCLQFFGDTAPCGEELGWREYLLMLKKSKACLWDFGWSIKTSVTIQSSMLKAAFQLPSSHPVSRTYFRALLPFNVQATLQKEGDSGSLWWCLPPYKHQMAFYPDVLTAAEKAHCRKWLLPSYTQFLHAEKMWKGIGRDGVKDVFYLFRFSPTERKLGLLLLFFGATKDYGVPYFLFSSPLFLTARLSSDVAGSTAHGTSFCTSVRLISTCCFAKCACHTPLKITLLPCLWFLLLPWCAKLQNIDQKITSVYIQT